MVNWGVVEANGVVEVYADVVQAVNDQTHDGYEPDGGTCGALRHA